MRTGTPSSRGHLGCVVASAILMSALTAVSHGQDQPGTSSDATSSSASYSGIPVTRWVDSEGRLPTGYQVWKARQPQEGPLEITAVVPEAAAKAERAGTMCCVIVNTMIYADIEPWINRHVLELTGEGYDPRVYVTTGGTPDGFRSFLQDKYSE